MQQAVLQPSKTKPHPWYAYLWRMIRHPLRAGREIAAWSTVWPGLTVVLALGIYIMQACFRSYLNQDYPPPPADLAVWIAAWGEFSMLPLPALNIPPEDYRLFMALIAQPVTLGAWLLMAAVAVLLARVFHRPAALRPYLNLFAFSFYPFWFLAALGDGLYSTFFGPSIVPALRGDLGALAQAAFTYYPPLLYTVLFGLGAVYNGLAAYALSTLGVRLRGWQAALIGLLTFVPPLVLVALLFR